MLKKYFPAKHLWYCLAFLMLTFSSFSQSLIISWDSETGCQVYGPDGPRKFLEDIQDGTCLRACENKQITYTITGDTNLIASTSWSVQGGTIINSLPLHAQIEWGAAGFGNIGVTITFIDNTVKTYNLCVEKILAPKSKFAVYDGYNEINWTSCTLQDIYFTNLSNTNGGSPIVSYFWDFDDGTTSSALNPVHAFAANGIYRVALTVTNSCSCTAIFSQLIYIGKEGNQILCPSVVCEGELANYTSIQPNSEIRCDGTQWSVSGGTIVSNSLGLNVLWNNVDSTGFGYVSFDTSRCNSSCPSVNTIKVPVVQAHGTIQGEQLVCASKQYIYSLPQWPTTEFTWQILSGPPGATLIYNDQRNQIILNTSTSGTIVLRCDYYNTLLHCSGQAIKEIAVISGATVEGPKKVCQNDSVEYTFHSDEDNTILPADWTLDGPNGTTYDTTAAFHPVFSAPGVYVLTATYPGYCAPDPVYITVKAAPIPPDAITGPIKVCPSVANIYNVTNLIADTEIAWDVTGGTILGAAFGDQVSITFNFTGPYEVWAYRRSKKEPHCSSTAQSLTVELLNPNLEITSNTIFNPVCSSTYAQFAVSEVGVGIFNGAETYNWTIDPVTAGSVVAGQNSSGVTILWNQPTTPFATLAVEIKKCGLTFNTSQQITVVSVPPISINAPTSVCAGEPVNFSINGYVSGAVSWDFGFGNASQQPLASFTFPQNSTSSTVYNISVTVQNPNGCTQTATASSQITVTPVPPATMTLSGTVLFCTASQITPMYINIQGGFGNTTEINWYLSGTSTPLYTQNSSTPGGITGIWTAPDFGNYYAVVTYNNSFNNCDTTTNIVTIVPYCGDENCVVQGNPAISLSANVNACLTISCLATFSGTPGTPSNFQWHLPSGLSIVGSATASAVTLLAAQPGAYNIAYEGFYPSTDSGFCSIYKVVQVVVPYKAELLYSISCGSDNGSYALELYDHSTRFPGINITHQFYDITTTPVLLNTADTEVWNISNLVPGTTHTYQLSISNGVNAPCVSTVTVTIPLLPDASFTFTNSPACIREPINFSAADLTSGNSYLWDFGDSAANIRIDPEREYTSGGPKSVKLRVTNQYGCSKDSTQTVQVNVFESMTGDFLPLNSQICNGSSVLISFLEGPHSPSSFQWMNGTTPINGATNSTYNATENGSYWLVLGDIHNCKENINGSPAIVNMIQPPMVELSGPTTICVGDTVNLEAYTATENATFTWSFDNMIQPAWQDFSEISYIPTAAGTYEFAVKVGLPAAQGGCQSIANLTVTVLDPPAEPIIQYSIDCANYTVSLWVDNVLPGSYTWSNGNSGPTATSHNGGPFQVRYFTDSGCSRASQIDVPKNPEDYIWIFPNGCFEFCEEFEPQNLQIIGPAPAATITSWRWLESGASVAGGIDAVATYTINAPGSYQLYYNNSFCDIESKPMELSQHGCTDCRLKVDVKSAPTMHKDIDGICYYEFVLEIENQNLFTLYTTITDAEGYGVLSPNTLVIAPLSTVTITFTFYPTSTFVGGPFTLTFNGEDDRHRIFCKQTKRFDLPTLNCDPINSITTDTSGDEFYALLQLIPNPASNFTEVHYRVRKLSETQSATIEVYDLVGRPMGKVTVNDTEGVETLSLVAFPAGYYTIVLTQNGKVLKQQKLIVK